MAKEIELTFDLQNKEEVVNFLNENADFEKEENQIDIYYNLPHRNFLKKKPVNEWLRLRKSDKSCSINYKNYYDNQPICDEYEEEINGIENVEDIFSAIGIQEMIRVNKNRKIRKYKGYTICIDSVDELWDFIEIETIRDWDEDFDNIKQELYKLKEALKVKSNGENNTGYPYDLMHKKWLL